MTIDKKAAFKKDSAPSSKHGTSDGYMTGDVKGNRSGTPMNLKKMFDSSEHKKAVSLGKANYKNDRKYDI